MKPRRRFLTIAAAAIALPSAGRAAGIHTWQGTALGARATIRLDHPDAGAITARVAAEIDRLEHVFSLYRPDSTLSRLNAASGLRLPPFELLECLSIADAAHDSALATSAPLGTTFHREGRLSHIVDPRSGRPSDTGLREITVTGPSAAMADAFTTAARLMPSRDAIERCLVRLPELTLQSVRFA